MRKLLCYIVIIHFIATTAWSQSGQSTPGSRNIDSFKQALLTATDDSIRVQLLGEIAFRYEMLNYDSAMKYLLQAKALAERKGYSWADAGIMINQASITRQHGNLGEALELLFRVVKINEAEKNFEGLARAYRRLSDVYIDLENFPKAKFYLDAAWQLDETGHRQVSLMIDHMTLGYVYEKMNQLDTALLHANLALNLATQTAKQTQYILCVLGSIQLKNKEEEKAFSTFQQGLQLSLNNGDYVTAAEISINLATHFTQKARKDSALQYALKGFGYSQQTAFKRGIIQTSTLLASLYDSIQPIVANKYYKIAGAAKDSLFGTSNIRMIQNLVSREEAKQKELEDAKASYRNRVKMYGLLTGLAALFIIAAILYRNNKVKQKANGLLKEQKNKVEETLSELKITQAQLIQSEKLASLGQLTAGIAHEIQNPLNFVNNFSEINTELIDEVKQETGNVKSETVQELLSDIFRNNEKIMLHGKRADAIVKGMLQHTRSSTGVKEATAINDLTDEYLRLSYHGMRNKDQSFSAKLETDFEHSIGKVNIIPQDIGTVLLNVYNNAFYAINEKLKNNPDDHRDEKYEPRVSVKTKKVGNKIEIIIADNGSGIPSNIVDKIFQPFFTTKPTGKGTGLGLSLAYDIVKAQGGEIKVNSKEGEGTVFIIQLQL